MIKDNQKNFSRLHVVIDACVITLSYMFAWALRFIGPFAANAVRARSFQQYMSALVFILPAYILLYHAFSLYEPMRMPMPVMASSDTEVVESLLDSGIDFLASDPGKAVDIIMYAKDLVDQQNITDDQVRSAVTQAADHFGVSLSDSEVDSLVSVVRKVLDAKIDEDALRSDVNSVYSKLQDMGVTKDDAKGLVSKLIEFVKGLFE